MPFESVAYKRRELYELVWAEPLRAVAQRHGISDVALAKACRKLAIPLPGRGYWARVAAGQAPRRVPLRRLSEGHADELTIRRRKPESPENVSAETQAAIARERDPTAAIVVAPALDHPHQLVCSAAQLLGHRSSASGVISCRSERCLRISVSPQSLDRALRIMDALLKALEARGLRVEVTELSSPPRYPGHEREGHNDTRVLIGDVWMSVGIEEIARPTNDAKPKSNTDAVCAAIHQRGGSRPVPRPIEGNPLMLSIRNRGFVSERCVWKDGRRQRLETCLNAFVAQLHINAEVIRRGREESAQRHRQWEAQEQRRKDEQRQADEYAKRAQELGERAARWRLAHDIREFIAETREAIAEAHLVVIKDSSLAESLEWAAAYAERIDPIAPVRAEVARVTAERQATQGTERRSE